MSSRDPSHVHPKRTAVAAFFGDPESVRRSGQRARWPPADAIELYRWGWDGALRDLGKEASLRAAVAARGWCELPPPAGSYERLALRAAMAWAVSPEEARRKESGRLASAQHAWSFEKVLAHMAGSRHRWHTITGLLLTGNPRSLPAAEFDAVCARIVREVIPWALGAHDPIAARLAADGEAWAQEWIVPDASRAPT